MPRKLGLAVLALVVAIAAAWWIRDSSRAVKTSAPIPTKGVGDSTSTIATPTDAVETRALDASNEPLPQAAVAQTSAARSVDEAKTAPRVADVLVAGRVVDARGQGIGGATVAIATFRDDRWLTTGVDATADASGSSSGLRTKADADGFFELTGSALLLEQRARAAPPRFGVRASATGFVAPTPVEFHVGDVGVTIVVAAEGRIAGVLAFSGDLASSDVRLAALDPAQTDPESALTIRPDAEGAFSIDRLRPGAWTVWVVSNAGQHLARIDDVVVASGETTRDPRLNPFHLDSARRLDVGVFLPDGTPAVDAIARLVRFDGQQSLWTELDRREPGVFSLFEEPDGIALHVSHAGMRNAYLEHVRGPTRIDLRPGLRVEIEVIDLPDVQVPDDRQLVLVLQQDPRDRTTQPILPKIHETALTREHPATFVLEEPGDYAWTIAEVAPFSPNRNYPWPKETQRVHVADTDATQALRVRAPDDLPEQLAASR